MSNVPTDSPHTIGTSIVRSGQWHGPVALSWSPFTQRLSVAAWGLVMATGVAAIAFGGYPALVVATLFFTSASLKILQTAPKPVGVSESPTRDEVQVNINLSDGIREVGVDSGILWFDAGRLYFSGQACSFALSKDDIEWPGRYDDVSAGKTGFRCLLRDVTCLISVTSDYQYPFSQKLSEFRNAVDNSVEDRQLPPLTPQPKLTKRLRWNELRMWTPFLVKSGDRQQVGGAIIHIAVLLGCWAAMVPFITSWWSIAGMIAFEVPNLCSGLPTIWKLRWRPKLKGGNHL